MMEAIDVCLSPDLMHLYDVEGSTVIVVDILRASSCITTAIAHGVKSIKPFASLEECQRMKEKGYIIAGERNGEKVGGFDLGNSPFEYMDKKLRNQKIAFTTTNGTQAIASANGAERIVIGAFLNLSALVEYMRSRPAKALIICSGWKGNVNLEDTIFAGAMVDQLQGTYKPDGDSPLIALDLYHREKANLKEFLRNSSHVQRLEKLNIREDITFCLTPDQFNVVPVLKDGEIVAAESA